MYEVIYGGRWQKWRGTIKTLVGLYFSVAVVSVATSVAIGFRPGNDAVASSSLTIYWSLGSHQFFLISTMLVSIPSATSLAKTATFPSHKYGLGWFCTSLSTLNINCICVGVLWTHTTTNRIYSNGMGGNITSLSAALPPPLYFIGFHTCGKAASNLYSLLMIMAALQCLEWRALTRCLGYLPPLLRSYWDYRR